MENTLPKWKIIVFVSAATLIFLIIAGLGAAVGYYIAVRPYKKLALHYDKFLTVGSLMANKDISPGLSKTQRHDFYKVYADEEHAKENAGNYSWMIPNTPTPFVGIAPTPGIHNNTRINRQQCRYHEDIVFPKPKGEIRIFLTGGSTAFGSGAPSQEATIGALLEKRLNRDRPSHIARFKVYILANPAWVSTHERIIIENRLSEMEADMVISLSGVNDVHWGGQGYNIYWFRTYIDDFFHLLVNRARRMAGKKEDPDIVTKNPKPLHPVIVSNRLTKNVLIGTYALGMKNIPYVFFLQPALAVTGKKLTSREKDFLVNQKYFTLCYRVINQQLTKLKLRNFHFFDLAGCFDHMKDQDPPPDIFLDSYHFGDKGNHIIAERMYLHLKRMFPQWQKLNRAAPGPS